jgi:hypothetical protein
VKRKAQRLWLRGFLRLLRAERDCQARQEERRAELLVQAVEIARKRLETGAIE